MTTELQCLGEIVGLRLTPPGTREFFGYFAEDAAPRGEKVRIADHAEAESEIARLQALVEQLAGALRADAAAIADGIRHDEYCDRANAEGWDNDPTGSSHISSSASRLRVLQDRAAEMKRAALAKVGR